MAPITILLLGAIADLPNTLDGTIAGNATTPAPAAAVLRNARLLSFLFSANLILLKKS
jgi:hypothetical protein